jgi:hypothetical protein
MIRRYVLSFLLTALLATTVSFPRATASITSRQTSGWASDAEQSAFVYEERGGQFICRPATLDEALGMNDGDRESMMRAISTGDFRPQSANALTIILRGTSQLDGFPQARDAFVRAADSWKARIEAPITIIIDVDFGPTRFGQAYPAGVLGSTQSQNLFSSTGYPDVREGLISKASQSEAALVALLPASQLPTDLGSTAASSAPSALLRALGVIDPVANPTNEPGFGPPPSIGFNSTFQFDFDPTNGIDSDKVDFDAVATHEIAHALGFTSRTGALELSPQLQLATTVLDIFRFRPGTTTGTFSTAQRVLSSGGQHAFFNGSSELSMSTGRPDGSGGDGNQASHWKTQVVVQPAIGIMIPSLALGERQTISDHDVRAMDLIGYNAVGEDGGGGDPDEGDPGGPVLNKASYENSVMTIKGSGFSGSLQLEVNGSIVGPPRKIKVKGGGAKLKIGGTRSQLNLQTGDDRVRVIADGLRSAVKTVDL